VPDQGGTAERQRRGGLDELGIDATNAGVGVQINWKQRAERNQRDLGCFANAKPKDEERYQRDDR
jgi:hypothetical protein